MELDRNEFDNTLSAFLSSWHVERVKKMTIEEYTDLSNHDSFCYWLEYGSVDLGAIGAVALHKFELWKPKEKKDFKDDRFRFDGTYAWNSKKGDTFQEAFFKIKQLILEIISNAQNQNWSAIDSIPFHSISKWKIAFLFSNKKLLPIYSKRALLAIGNGLGKEFPYKTRVSELQKFILSFKGDRQNVEDFAYTLYMKYAQKIKKPNYYIFGSKYGDMRTNIFTPKIETFLKYSCVAIGFLDWIDFSEYIGAKKESVYDFIDKNWKEERPSRNKVRRNFYLLSQLKAGDIIAVKSQGAYNQLNIIAYAQVVSKNGSIYEHNEKILGHHIHVDFLDADFNRYLGYNYAETIHLLTPKKDKEKFYKVFGWYAETLSEDNEAQIDDEEFEEDTNQAEEDAYNEKSEDSFERSGSASVKVNLVHNRIQNQFIKYLKKTYPNDIVRGEKRRIDAKKESDNEIIIYEIKPYQSAYTCIREGIGQLLDYSHQMKSKKNKQIIIVGPNEPEQRDIDFISELKSILQIKFSYVSFDESTAEARLF